MTIDDILSMSVFKRVIIDQIKEGNFRICGTKYPYPDTMDCVTVDLVSSKGEKYSVMFVGSSLIVDEGPLKKYELNMKLEYINVLREFFPDFKTGDDQLREFLTNAYTQCYLKTSEQTSISEMRATLNQFMHNQPLFFSTSYPKSRDFIPGEIYMADLNPATKIELGGVRPILILDTIIDKNGERLVRCVPLSTKVDDETEDIIVENLTDSRPSRVCYDYLKTIDIVRIKEKLRDADETLLNLVKNKLGIINPLSLEAYLAVQSADDEDEIKSILGISSDSEQNAEEKPEQPTANKESNTKTAKKGTGKTVVVKKKIFSKSQVSQTVSTEATEVKTANTETAKQPQNLETKSKSEIRFELNSYEIHDIVIAKLNDMKEHGSKLKFDENNIEIESSDLTYGIVVKIKREKYPTYATITLTPFSGCWRFGNKEYQNDEFLQKMVAQTLSNKYGEEYKKKYAYCVAEFYKNAKEHSVITIDRLQKSLSFIGKYAPNAWSILDGGAKALEYHSLQDVQEFE